MLGGVIYNICFGSVIIFIGFMFFIVAEGSVSSTISVRVLLGGFAVLLFAGGLTIVVFSRRIARHSAIEKAKTNTPEYRAKLKEDTKRQFTVIIGMMLFFTFLIGLNLLFNFLYQSNLIYVIDVLIILGIVIAQIRGKIRGRK